MKHSIKRAQSRAGSSFAERENFRPKVKQLKKTLLTLALLITAVTGAWADGVTMKEITISDIQSSWNGNTDPVKATDLPGFKAMTHDEAVALGAPSNDEFVFLIYAINANNKFAALIYMSGTKSSSEAEFNLNQLQSAVQNYWVYYTYSDASSGPEVAWDKAEKTGTFTMPGGNVELEPEYYPQATVADGGVTAADADARATTDDPLVKVDATKLTGAKKLMYFVSNSGTTAPAYDAEGWTDQLPTAEGFTQQGIVYVWYYPVGTDEGVDGATATYSDGDICLQSITARIAAAPTYAVTFADGVNPEPPADPEWTASPNADVTKGETVTVTYTGTKKVLGVKAEKKAAAGPKAAKDATAEDVGKLIGADGNIYDDADAATAANTTAVAMIAYVGSDAETSTTYNHGLALALSDVSSDTYTWCSQTSSTCLTTQYYSESDAKADMAGLANTDALVGHGSHTHAAASAARNYNSGTHPTGTSEWFLPSAGQWDKMATAAGGYGTLKTNAGLQSSLYWSSSESYEANAWSFVSVNGYWASGNKGNGGLVRACLAF